MKIDWKILMKSIWETLWKSVLFLFLIVLALGPVPLIIFISPWFFLIYPVAFFCIQVEECYKIKKYEAED